MLTGRVDVHGRALVQVSLYHPTTGARADLEVWIDTGFTGALVLPALEIATLGLPQSISLQAVLADGSTTQVTTFEAVIDWFGTRPVIEVVSNQGQFPLLGVALLVNRELRINYPARTVTVR